MPIEFAYAQARILSRHGDRLSAADWRVLDASRTLASFLQAVRATLLAPSVQNLSQASSPHDIERTLRSTWRNEVEHAARWVAAPWQAAVRWTASIVDLDAISYLDNGGQLLPWMSEEPALAYRAAGTADSRDTPSGIVTPRPRPLPDDESTTAAAWLAQWRERWPDGGRTDAIMQPLLRRVERYRAAMRDEVATASDASERIDLLARDVVRILRANAQQPVAIFCHLLLTAIELSRLRRGLLRRALVAGDRTTRLS